MDARGRALTHFAKDIRSATLGRARRMLRAADRYPQGGVPVRLQQLSLLLQYAQLRRDPHRPPVRDMRFDVFSPGGEDGSLLYIFGLIGFGSRRCVDLGGAGLSVSNTANLIVHHEFDGLVVDGDEAGIHATTAAYRRHVSGERVSCVASWITRENVDDLLVEHGVESEIDLLSIDLDGIDYWILEALTAVRPRVIVLEYQDILGPDRCWTVPYRPDFDVNDHPVNANGGFNYCGASLAAFDRLLRARDYRLVGCNRDGYNAFFVDESAAGDVLPRVEVADCLRSKWNVHGMANRFPLVADMDWVDVGAADATNGSR